MTYNEIKRRLTKCEKTLALFQKQDLSKATSTERQQAQTNIISVNESINRYKKMLAEINESKTYIVTPKSGQTSAVSMSDDEVEALKDADDVEAIKSVDGDEVKERLTKNSGVEFSIDETKAIAKQVGKAVAKSLKAVGDSVSSMKATHIEENSFDIDVIYKNNSDDAFSFHIVDDTLHLADFSFDKELVDVGVKPSGEAIVNVDVLSNELQKHFKSLNEKLSYNGREFSHEEEDRLDLIAHREFDGKDFSNLSDEDKAKVFAKRHKVGVEEGEGDDHHYLKVSRRDYKKTMSILDNNIDPTYVKTDIVDDDGAGNVTIYFIFRHEYGFDDMYDDPEGKENPELYQEPDEDPSAFMYDVVMDLQAQDIEVVDHSADMDENVKEDNGGYTKHKLLAYLGQADDAMIRTHDDKYLIIYNPKNGNDDNAAMWHDDTVFGVDADGQEHEVRYDQIDRLQLENTDEATDINDPVLMKMRASKKRNDDLKKLDQMKARDRKDQRINGKKRLLIKQLKDKRAEIEREMENDPEIEPTGGPVADRYGDMLNKIDNAIEKAAGRIKPLDYDTAVGKVNEEEGHLVTFGYDLDRIGDVVKHLQSKYKEGQDFELHIGRGDDLPNAVTLKSPALEDDADLNDMLNAAQSDQDRYDAYTDYDQRRREDDDYYEDPDYYKESMKEGTELYDKGGMQIKRFSGGERGVMVQITVPSQTSFGGDYIQVTAEQFETLARAMQSVVGDLRDMTTQVPRKKNVDEIKAAKVQKAHGLVVAKMKELAKQYKAGDKSVVPQLKDLTAKKKALEADLEKAVAGTHQGQELTELTADQRNELVELQNILDDVAQRGDEAREIIRQSFPKMLSKADAYGAFNFGSSANRYDTTLESIIEEIEEYYDEDEDDMDEGEHQGSNYKWPMSKATKDRKEADKFAGSDPKAGSTIKGTGFDWKKKPLKEFTDRTFTGSELIDDTNDRGPDMFGKQIFADLLPKGVASENDAFEALKKHDKSGIKQRMGQYAPMFVHMQYHELEHEGEKYRMHQKQYYNSNFKDKDPDFNPAVSQITLMKVGENDEGKNLGTILVKTDEYVQDLRNLPGLGKRHMEEAGPGFKHDCAAHVVHEVYGAGICLDEQHTLVKEGNKHVVTHYDVFFKKGNRLVEDVPAEHLKVITMNEHWHKGYKKKKK